MLEVLFFCFIKLLNDTDNEIISTEVIAYRLFLYIDKHRCKGRTKGPTLQNSALVLLLSFCFIGVYILF